MVRRNPYIEVLKLLDREPEHLTPIASTPGTNYDSYADLFGDKVGWGCPRGEERLTALGLAAAMYATRDL